MITFMVCTECEHAVDDHAVKGTKLEDECIMQGCGCKLRLGNQEQLGPSPYAVDTEDRELPDGSWIDFYELTLCRLGFLIYLVDQGAVHEWPTGPKWDKFWTKETS